MTSMVTLCLHPVSRLRRHIRQQQIELNILIYLALSLVKMGKPGHRCSATSLRWYKILMLCHQSWEGKVRLTALNMN